DRRALAKARLGRQRSAPRDDAVRSKGNARRDPLAKAPAEGAPFSLSGMTLEDRIATGASADEAMDWFLGWVKEIGLQPYAAQEEAILELFGKSNVILATPTGSGKSLVAMAACFLAMCEGKRAVYTVPIRALAN